MTARFRGRRLPVFLLCAVLLGVTCSQAAAPAAKQPKAPKPFKGRLPNHFGAVVTEQQRQAIYDIQREYHPRIERLKQQLKTLTDQRDARIDAVLSPEQRAQVAGLKEAAKAKRKAGKAKQEVVAEPKAPEA